MAGVVSMLFGLFLLCGGILSAINHSVIDGINRWLKATGTTQRPSDIQMSQTSKLTGRIFGTVVAVIGLFIILDGLT